MRIIKKPLYVEIYEKIYDMILNGEIQPGDRIPGEVELSKQYNISRSTLRQALLILKENGIIYNKQGTGNFVSAYDNHRIDGLEKLIPIPSSFCKEQIEGHLLNTVFEVPNAYISKRLQLEKSALVMNCHKTFTVDGNPAGYSLYQIPTDVLKDYDIDLQDDEAIQKFAEEDILTVASKSDAHIVFTEVGEFLEEVLKVPLNEKVVMIEEVFYDTVGMPVGISRHSILPEYFDFNLTRSGI